MNTFEFILFFSKNNYLFYFRHFIIGVLHFFSLNLYQFKFILIKFKKNKLHIRHTGMYTIKLRLGYD